MDEDLALGVQRVWVQDECGSRCLLPKVSRMFMWLPASSALLSEGRRVSRQGVMVLPHRRMRHEKMQELLLPGRQMLKS